MLVRSCKLFRRAGFCGGVQDLPRKFDRSEDPTNQERWVNILKTRLRVKSILREDRNGGASLRPPLPGFSRQRVIAKWLRSETPSQLVFLTRCEGAPAIKIGGQAAPEQRCGNSKGGLLARPLQLFHPQSVPLFSELLCGCGRNTNSVAQGADLSVTFCGGTPSQLEFPLINYLIKTMRRICVKSPA